jgi:SSS family solute:Na+ symporter
VPVSLVILILYIVALFAISWYAKKRSEGNNENFALAGRRLSAPLICVTIIGLAVGGASTIGVSEHAFRVGLSAGWYTIAWALGAIVMGLFMAKKYREQNITTITELIERHHTKGAVILGVFCQIVIQLVIISLQYIAGGSILHAILPDIFDFHTGMIVSAITFIGITFIGGMWSASLSNVLNIILIYVGILAATIIQFKKIGSMDHLAAALPANVPWFSFIDGVGPVTITSWVVTLITVNLSLQSILQISLGAKDAATAKKGFVWGGILMLPVGVLAAFLGLVAKAMYPDAQAALALPQVLAGVTLAALWAADVSTACNLLLSAGTLFSSDIYKRFINPQCDQARQLLMTRACIIISGILTLGLAMSVSSILGTIMIGLSLTAAFSVIVIVALFFPQYASKAAGFWTLLAGLVLLVLWQLTPAVRIFPNVIYMEWLVCIAAYAIAAIVCPAKKAVAAESN